MGFDIACCLTFNFIFVGFDYLCYVDWLLLYYIVVLGYGLVTFVVVYNCYDGLRVFLCIVLGDLGLFICIRLSCLLACRFG